MLAILAAGFSETVVASGISSSTAMEIAPNGDLWILEQGGAVKRFRPGTTTADIVGNVSTLGLSSAGERGLLGIAFDPQYSSSKGVFLYYTATTPNIHNRISRFTVNDADAADYYFEGASTVPTDAGSSGTPTQSIILELDALSGATNHNGGAIHFGPDGMLYAAVGDNANGANAQILGNLHGKMLRINSDGTIPSDNPFFNVATNEERSIWALGLRNPFTFAFQAGTDVMFINDVGEAAWEEINEGIAGSNYGWPSVEGNEGTPPAGPGTYRAPLYAYAHGGGPFEGFAITGGAFYNPAVQQFPAAYAGDYFFADFVNDWINVRDASSGDITQFATSALGAVDLRVSSDGSLYYLARGVNQAFHVTSTASAVIQILDSGQAGYSEVGSGWTPSSFVSGGYGSDYRYQAAGAGQDIATWTFQVTPGLYRVSAAWQAAPNRATDAPYSVLDGTTLRGTTLINQELVPNDFTDAGAVWEDLGGPYTVNGNTLVVRLSNAANEFVIADAIRIERIGDVAQEPEIQVLDGTTEIADGTGSVSFGSVAPGAPLDKTFTVKNLGLQPLTLTPPISTPPGFTVLTGFSASTVAPGASATFTLRFSAPTDGAYGGTVSFGNNDGDENPFNFAVSAMVQTPAAAQILDSGQAGYSEVGSGWTPSSFVSGGYGSDYRYQAAGAGQDIATWTFQVTPGLYRVSAAWQAAPNRATDAPYSVLDGTTLRGTTLINQELVPNDFTDAGAVWEDLGGPYTVNGNTLVVRLSNAANEFVIADAIRIERIGDVAQEPEIQVLDGTTEIADGTGSVSFGSVAPGAPLDKTFTVKNLGLQPLTLTPPISTPPGFTVLTGFSASTVAPGASATFTLRFSAPTDGAYGGTVSFGNNDGDENPFNFAVSAMVQTPAAAQILDSGQAGYSEVGSGWTPSSFVSGGYGSDYRYQAAGAGQDIATWTFQVTPGLYRVSAAWQAAPNRATDAPYSVLDGTTLRGTTLINQELVPNDFTDAGAVWEDLGGPYTVNGNTLVVRLSNAANEFVIADAIRIERIGDVAQEPEIQMSTESASRSTSAPNLDPRSTNGFWDSLFYGLRRKLIR